MDPQLTSSITQLGLGAVIAMTVVAALIKTLFRILSENRALRRDLLERQYEWEERFFLGMVDCINRNTMALEKMQDSLDALLSPSRGDQSPT